MKTYNAWIRSSDKVVVYADLGLSSGMQKGITAALDNNIDVEFRSLDGSITKAELVQMKEKCKSS